MLFKEEEGNSEANLASNLGGWLPGLENRP